MGSATDTAEVAEHAGVFVDALQNQQSALLRRTPRSGSWRDWHAFVLCELNVLCVDRGSAPQTPEESGELRVLRDDRRSLLI